VDLVFKKLVYMTLDHDLGHSVRHIIRQRCTTFLGQGSQRYISSALEGRRQNYEQNFLESSRPIKSRIFKIFT